MSAVYLNTGRISDLDTLIANATYEVRLYQNNFTPLVGSVLGDFTVATFSGYAAQAPTFGAAAIDGNGNAKADASALSFTHNGGGTANSIYGWYMVDTGTGVVCQAERFAAAPLSFAVSGDDVTVTPHLYGGPVTPPL